MLLRDFMIKKKWTTSSPSFLSGITEWVIPLAHARKSRANRVIARSNIPERKGER